MPHVPTPVLEEMIKSQPPSARRVLADVIKGKIVKEIRCKSKNCKGAVIGHVYANGRLVEAENKKKDSGALSFRQRYDGFIGVRCRCGNSSIIAEQEDGIVGSHVPSKHDLENIFSNIQQKPPKHPVRAGKQIVDGFEFKEVA